MDLLSLELFTGDECDRLLDDLRAAAGNAAPVYGLKPQGAVDPLVRRATRLQPSDETQRVIREALANAQERLSQHFGVALASFEEPQFLRYQAGDYFVAHQDGNTPAIHDDSRHRRVSGILFLSDEGDYSGGTLLFHRSFRDRVPASARRGTLLAFRSELTHEVLPLTGGERYTVVTWYRLTPAESPAATSSRGA